VLHPTTDFFEFKNGLNPDSKRFGSGTKFISVMDILNNRYITYEKIIALVEPKGNDLKEFGVNYGDVLFQRSSETLEDVGRANVYMDKKTALFGGFVIRGKKIGEYDPLFFRYLLSCPHVRKKIVVKGAGAQHFNIGQDGLSKISIFVPTAKEQERIAQLLDLIDERIETQIRIIEELKLLRNTLMFKLFTPKDKWLKLSIGDVAHVIGGGTPDTNIEDYWNGNIQWFTPSEIGKEKYVTESERTLTQKGLDNSSAKLLPPNTILLSTRATIGECSIAKQECCTNQGFQSLIATTVTPEFLYYLIQTKRRDLLSKASGSTFAEISANEVRRIHICIPATATEQEIIVRPLSAYDEKIETEYKMLHLFKMQKQYLLSHMFI